MAALGIRIHKKTAGLFFNSDSSEVACGNGSIFSRSRSGARARVNGVFGSRESGAGWAVCTYAAGEPIRYVTTTSPAWKVPKIKSRAQPPNGSPESGNPKEVALVGTVIAT